MVEGIYYYPKQKKSKSKHAKLAVAILVLGAIIFYYLATDEQIIEKSQKNLITIKEAESDAAKIITIPLNVETSSSISTNNDKVKKPEILENLDEVLQIQQKLR